MGYSLYDVKVSVIMRSKGAFSWRRGRSESWPPSGCQEASGQGSVANGETV